MDPTYNTHARNPSSISDIPMKPPHGTSDGVDQGMTGQVHGHMMAPDDPDNPQNWPLHQKIYASAAATAFGFTVAFGLTAYTAGIPGIMSQFNVSMTVAVAGMSLYFLGIVFAPIYTPHVVERTGRTMVYLTTILVFALFTLGAGFSQDISSLLACRFFAGLFGGPSLVLIEGTFADVWSADVTVSYYAVLSLASYVGAGAGPIVGNFVVAVQGWRWAQWVTLMIALGALLLGIALPETYPREILRRRAKRRSFSITLAPAQSGVSLAEMSVTTIFQPLKMLVTEPIVIMSTLYLAFNFGVIFQFFISIPVVLNLTYAFGPRRIALAFTSAVGASFLAAITAIIIDRLAFPKAHKKAQGRPVDIEYRMLPAMVGGVGITASLFWIAWTADPKIPAAIPILGTALYVWGNMCVLISFVSYLFDAYPPAATLSALTVAASTRLLFAAAFPLFIIPMIMRLTGAWAISTFGFIAAALMPFPWILWAWGAGMRARSSYNRCGAMGASQGVA